MKPKTIAYAYDYDQLNRLLAMDADSTFDSTTYQWTGGASPVLMNAYKERVAYDANGNILTYLRHGNNPVNMDSLTYFYPATSNRLNHVDDKTTYSSNYSTDIDDQAGNNYTYDKIGNLTSDVQEGLDITWNVYGKVKSVTDAVEHKLINFAYDAGGNRLKKQVINTSTHDTSTTYYVRDAQGNILSTYLAKSDTVWWNEQMLYGSSRVGVADLSVATYPIPVLIQDTIIPYPEGWKQYELTNHLGNVMVTVSDKKIGIPKTSNPAKVDYWVSEVLSKQDYYPFGSTMPGRYFSSDTYRFGFNGKENDGEIEGVNNSQDYGMRIYNPRLGKFLSIDPIAAKFPYYSPYEFAGDKPIVAIDLDGKEDLWVNTSLYSAGNGGQNKIYGVYDLDQSLKNQLVDIFGQGFMANFAKEYGADGTIVTSTDESGKYTYLYGVRNIQITPSKEDIGFIYNSQLSAVDLASGISNNRGSITINNDAPALDAGASYNFSSLNIDAGTPGWGVAGVSGTGHIFTENHWPMARDILSSTPTQSMTFSLGFITAYRETSRSGYDNSIAIMALGIDKSSAKFGFSISNAINSNIDTASRKTFQDSLNLANKNAEKGIKFYKDWLQQNTNK